MLLLIYTQRATATPVVTQDYGMPRRFVRRPQEDEEAIAIMILMMADEIEGEEQ